VSTSPTYIQDQALLRDFMRLPDGQWLSFRKEFLALYNAQRVQFGWGQIDASAWQIRRGGTTLFFRSNGSAQEQKLVDLYAVPEGQSVALAFALAFTLTFALAFTFTFTFALALAFAIDYEFETNQDAHDKYYHWDQFQASSSGLVGAADGFRLGDSAKQTLKMVGAMHGSKVDLLLTGLTPEKANRIIAIMND